MPPFDEEINALYDVRVGTLASIKARCLGMDTLTLAALNVLVYAQLEGGIKEIASKTIKQINMRRIPVGRLAPCLMKWRADSELERFRQLVTFDLINQTNPFAAETTIEISLRQINTRYEYNQMTWETLNRIYEGFGLSTVDVQKYASSVDDLVDSRNNAAHHGMPTASSSNLLELQVRSNATLVSDILSDFCLQLMNYFQEQRHLRQIPKVNSGWPFIAALSS